METEAPEHLQSMGYSRKDLSCLQQYLVGFYGSMLDAGVL